MLSVGAQSNYLIENTGEITDNQKHVVYRVGRFLGKGGFARCYEVTIVNTSQKLAAKVVSRESITKKSARSKMVQEIRIHRDLKHPNVVKMLDHFTDEHNVYCLMELCESQSLMELHKRRTVVSEEEARYFMGQIISGMEYVHDQKVIHRDLKLGNLFLTGDMIVKIGDFGLATRAEEGVLKKGLCGTPNYTAPEMLGKKGHSYEVDIWALGCILYTLLVGKPPFETTSLQDTYGRIKKNRYSIPHWITENASCLIRQLLAAQPQKRPKVYDILKTNFFTQGYWPRALPTTCLTMRPKFNFLSPEEQDMCSVVNQTRCISLAFSKKKESKYKKASPKKNKKKTSYDTVSATDTASTLVTPSHERSKTSCLNDTIVEVVQLTPEEYIEKITKLLSSFINKNSSNKPPKIDDIIEPSCRPVFWISLWVDMSESYGFGYKLNDNSSAVLFNDNTTLSIDGSGKQAQYIDKAGDETFFELKPPAFSVPEFLNKKMKVMARFDKHLEGLRKAGESFSFKSGDELLRLPIVRRWVRMRHAIFMLLDSGTLQVNFFDGHDKYIICPLMEAVTCLSGDGRVMQTFKISKMEKHGVPPEIRKKLYFIDSILSSGRFIQSAVHTHLSISSCPPTPTSVSSRMSIEAR
ncbi:hypothetical protein QR680_017763 [Steinernema hermaphroditum]|uniref:Serine/threonine-protein kinase PLK n=1 Tax=Steinernema hermaphroditum TaxID=289476 RepID=A0AA39HFQ1_9BILA|nr:hypothetical protein QR680_017763 [Steinernema hermaphroditum]